MSEMRSYGICLDVANFMRCERYPDGYTIFDKADGTPMEPAEALAWLSMERAKGRKVIPCSSTCGNPCSGKGCTGFDYSGPGCPGRIQEAPVSVGQGEER